jgi:N-acetylneuraminic acid mutarotase
MNHARWGLGVVTVDGKIYAIGGFTDYSHFLGTNERYDPKTDKWTTLTAMPTARHSLGIVAYQGKIYCIGGIIYENGQWFTCKTNEVYDIATDNWSSKASTPFESYIGRNWWSTIQLHVVDEKIFVINDGEMYLYDPVTDSWTEKTRAPHIGYGASAVVDNKLIVYVKMVNFMAVEAKTLVYDTETDKWSEMKTQMFTTNVNSVVVVGATTGRYAPQRIYVFIEENTWVHDPISDTWSSAKAVPTDCAGCGVAVIDDLMYIIGGVLNEQYVPIGYRSTAYTTPTPSNSAAPSETEPSDSTKPFLNPQIVAVVLILTSVTITAGLFLYFKRKTIKKEKSQEISPL